MTARSHYELVLFSDGEVLNVQVEGNLGPSGARHLSEIQTAAQKLGIEVHVERNDSSHN